MERKLGKDYPFQEHVFIFGEIIYNRRVVYAEKFASNYFSHFNPAWLFITGDTNGENHAPDRTHAPGMGNLYLISFPFILLGIYFLLRRTFLTSWIIFFC